MGSEIINGLAQPEILLGLGPLDFAIFAIVVLATMLVIGTKA